MSTRREAMRQSFRIPEDLAADVAATLDDWRAGDKVRRLWSRDATLWTGADEAEWLGWLDVAEDRAAHLKRLAGIASEVKRSGFTHALLLGMGGSSLCAEVLKETFGVVPGFPDLLVLDSTDPAQIRSLEERVDLDRTLFVVSSKSGTTLEPVLFKEYFFAGVAERLGAVEAGRRFIAVTDPGSPLQRIAEADRFRTIVPGVPGIGGRYSALSDFGLVPAAIMGLDPARLLDSAGRMAGACAPGVPPAANPGAVLGAVLGVLGRNGRDKVTLLASPGIGDFGAWIEQLLAESTGKEGKGLIPVDRERPAGPETYGGDRLFVYARLEGAPDPAQDAAVDRLEKAGQPVVRIGLIDRHDLGGEFFRWEIATAVAGSILGIHPFNQPDVEASKVATRQLTADYERTGALPPERPFLAERGLALYADDRNARALRGGAGAVGQIVPFLRAHLARLAARDYFAILAYLERSEANQAELQAMRHAVRDARRVATCLGFGPRFLHSTGQAYKGGPDRGVFLQVTCDDAVDLPVPGRAFSFGVVKAAQARGDFQVLAERGRRALRVHLGPDVRAGLRALLDALREALI